MDASVPSRAQIFLRLRLRGNGLISVFFFPSPTSASTKLRKQCVTCGSLLPATCFIRPVLKVAYLAPDVPAHFRTLNFFFLLLFVHSQEVDRDFKDLYIFIYFLFFKQNKTKTASPGFLKPAKIYS